MQLRSGGLLFPENGSVGDFRGRGVANQERHSMLLGVLGSILEAFLLITNRSKIEYIKVATLFNSYLRTNYFMNLFNEVWNFINNENNDK